MGYDYKVEKGTTLIVSIGTYNTEKGTWNKKFSIPVEKGQELCYEIYMEDGELSDR